MTRKVNLWGVDYLEAIVGTKSRLFNWDDHAGAEAWIQAQDNTAKDTPAEFPTEYKGEFVEPEPAPAIKKPQKKK